MNSESRYSFQFKQATVELLMKSERTQKEIAADRGIAAKTAQRWMRDREKWGPNWISKRHDQQRQLAAKNKRSPSSSGAAGWLGSLEPPTTRATRRLRTPRRMIAWRACSAPSRGSTRATEPGVMLPSGLHGRSLFKAAGEVSDEAAQPRQLTPAQLRSDDDPGSPKTLYFRQRDCSPKAAWIKDDSIVELFDNRAGARGIWLRYRVPYRAPLPQDVLKLALNAAGIGPMGISDG